MSAPDPAVHHHEVVVVGADSPGLAQVLELRAGGIDDVVVLEKGEALGNTGPFRHPLAGDDDLRDHVRSGHEVTGASWDEESRTWTVRTRGREGACSWFCRYLVVGLDVSGLDISGRDGRTLRGTWAEHGTATHLGITVSDFPNLFLLLDPHTGLSRDTAASTVERRTRYVRRAIETVRALGMSGLDVRAEVQQRFIAATLPQRARSRWTSTAPRWFGTRRFEPEDFEFFGRAADAARAGSGPGGHGGRVSRVTPADQALLHDGGDEDAVTPVEPTARETAPTSRVR